MIMLAGEKTNGGCLSGSVLPSCPGALVAATARIAGNRRAQRGRWGYFIDISLCAGITVTRAGCTALRNRQIYTINTGGWPTLSFSKAECSWMRVAGEDQEMAQFDRDMG